MKKKLFIITCVVFAGFFYYLNKENQKSTEVLEQEIQKQIVQKGFAESLKKINVLQKKHSRPEEIKENTRESLVVRSFKMTDLENLPGSVEQKKKTENFLNLIRTLDEDKKNNNIVDFDQTLKWVEALNQDPEYAQSTYEFLLNHPELKSKNGVIANLLKISTYATFNKKVILDFAKETIDEGAVVPSLKNLEDIEGSGRFSKVKESAAVLLNATKGQKESMVEMAKNIISQNSHPLLVNEVIMQVKIQYPEEGNKLETDSAEANEEPLDTFIKREIER